MKVLFLAIDRENNLGNSLTNPMATAYLSSILKKNNHDVGLIIPEYEKRYLKKIKEFSPDVIAYSVSSGSERAYLSLNSYLKKIFKFFSIFGGPHPTFFPDLMMKDDNVDSICIGEGEYAILELINRLERNEDYFNVKNFWFKEGKEIIKNPVRDLICNLDELPFPDNDLIKKYDISYNKKVLNVLTSRGCPFNCTYCFNGDYKKIYYNKGNILRKRSVRNVIDEIVYFKDKYDIKVINFIDDLFFYDENWLKEFSEIYPKEINLPFYCNLRFEQVNENTIKLLKKCNVTSINFGLESGNEETRRKILNRVISNKTIVEACRTVKNYGITLTTQNMVGIPFSSLKEDFETLELNMKCNVDLAWVSILQPYKGTKIYDMCNDFDLKGSNFESYHFRTRFKSEDSYKIDNLHKLFSLTVRFKFLYPLTKRMININNPLYFHFLRYFWGSWMSYGSETITFKTSKSKIKSFLKNFILVALSRILKIAYYKSKNRRRSY